MRNRIEYNRVLNTSLETYDTGGIEVTQQDKDFRSGSVIRNNVVGDSIGYSSAGPKPVFMSWGIYLDSYAGGYTVTHNVTYRSSHGGVMLQGGKDNRVENNIFVDGTIEPGVRQQLRQQLHRPGVPAEHRLLYATRTPCSCPAAAWTSSVIRIDRNLYFHCRRQGAADPRLRGSSCRLAEAGL